MNESPSVSRLSIPHVLFIAFIALVAFYLGFSPVGDIGIHFNFNKFTYWYYNGLAPCVMGFISTLTGGLTARGHYAGGWVAGGAVLLVFGGMDMFFNGVDPTDRPIQSVEFMVAGVALGIFILYVWNSRSRNH